MIDRLEIYVFGGKGGNGIVSFRREKYVPFGGPNGGDGGNGGSIVLVGDQGKTTLSDLRHQKHYRAQNGGHGRGKEQHGRKGGDLELKVPLGTLVRVQIDGGTRDIGDITREGQRLMVARGGKGGHGNKHFATSVKQAPRIATDGEPGEEKKLVLDLKLLADVGLVGRPNVGKSTLINAVSAARSKVADYPFTTLEPKLGVVELGYKAFVIADIPGLIEGAHAGHGLGHNFLRHVERTRILIHIIDGTSENPQADLEEINHELFRFNPALRQTPQIIALNKIDIPEVRERIPQIEGTFGGLGVPVHFISAATAEGLPELMQQAAQMLEEVGPAPVNPEGEAEFKVFRPRPIHWKA